MQVTGSEFSTLFSIGEASFGVLCPMSGTTLLNIDKSERYQWTATEMTKDLENVTSRFRKYERRAELR